MAIEPRFQSLVSSVGAVNDHLKLPRSSVGFRLLSPIPNGWIPLSDLNGGFLCFSLSSNDSGSASMLPRDFLAATGS